MQLSIRQILDIAPFNNIAWSAVNAVLADSIYNQNYALTEQDAEKCIKWIQNNRETGLKIGEKDLFGEEFTADQWLDRQREHCAAFDALARIFRAIGVNKYLQEIAECY